MTEIPDDELDTWRGIVDSALQDLDNGGVEQARAEIRHLRDCL